MMAIVVVDEKRKMKTSKCLWKQLYTLVSITALTLIDFVAVVESMRDHHGKG